MLEKLTSWLKNNKVQAVLVVGVLYLAFSRGGAPVLFQKESVSLDSYAARGGLEMAAMAPYGNDGISFSNERLVDVNANASAVVESVNDSITSIISKANEYGGFMVSSSVDTPTGLANGYVSVRIPTENINDLLNYLESISVKIVSKNIYGNDITSQYEDVEKQIEILQTSYDKYETLLANTTDPELILQLTDRLISTQRQIDNLVGRLDYLEKSGQTSLVSINLSTDEFELPYAPEEPWRPGVIFKLAVRSMISALQTIGSIVIYGLVYSPALILAAGLYFFFKNRKK